MPTDDLINDVYNTLRQDPPINEDGSRSDNHILGSLYWLGYDGLTPAFMVKNTQAHAAWRAGRDARKKGEV